MDYRDYGGLPIKKLAFYLTLSACWGFPNLALAVSQVDTSEWTSQVAEAQALEQQGDLEGVSSKLKQFADRGNGLAQFSYAWRIKDSAKPNSSELKLACSYFIKSADLNIPVGAQEAGHCYRDSVLIATDGAQLENAEKYYNIAIDNGLVASYCDIAALHQNQPSEKLNEMAGRCEQVAGQGAVYAQEILVDVYANSEGLNNNEKAIQWLEIAAEKSAKSAYRYALTLHQSGQIKPELTRFYFESAASKGYVPAYLETSALYLNGFAEAQDNEQAQAYLAKAYLWANAWKRTNPTAEAPEWVARIEQQVPATWKEELDSKVSKHVKQFSY